MALGHGAVARVAAERYVLVALGGSLVYLLAVALLYAEYGVLDMAELAARVRPSPTTGLALALAMAGLSAKAALLPLHGWLPPAHASAPAPASALLSALVVKAALRYLFAHDLRGRMLRFDVISVVGRGERATVEHIPGAFDAGM
ncbi:proton-conducting transporter transmembrane domain-containing protein [Myxococcus vastator]|uniref:proton-conducting transporter transmembrane domain-containing protein n=1 Tax=Myxococcus vastator TaxID=2709664 RepID=UPI003531DD6F